MEKWFLTYTLNGEYLRETYNRKEGIDKRVPQLVAYGAESITYWKDCEREHSFWSPLWG